MRLKRNISPLSSAGFDESWLTLLRRDILNGVEVTMRLYIYEITSHADEQKPDTYDFTTSIAGAWHWATQGQAEQARRLFEDIGIIIHPSLGASAPCTDFRVERRPEGGFAISCEHPFVTA
jgi:hypothetical protein